jgi:DNA modification methylase
MSPKQMSFSHFTSQDKKNFELNHIVFFGDIIDSLLTLKESSIDCVITSPPYWSQRDYGFENQIGNETTLEEYIKKLTLAFSILKNKMCENGVFFLNIGDKYLSKYGNTPLGLIPYKLVNSLMIRGWILQDILIWYKPNHMPSSVKNRFTNTYEPVFVLVKSKNNYFTKYFNSDLYTNLIKVTLQQTTYKHVATFPELLVEKLINTLELSVRNKQYIILDPFLGSGTTTIAIMKYNKQFHSNFSTIGIEAFEKSIQIIKERCNLNKNQVIKINSSIEFTPDELESHDYLSEIKNISLQINDYYSSNLLIRNCSNPKSKLKTINELHQENFYNSIEENGIILLVLGNFDIDFLLKVSSNNKWIIRNILIQFEGKICNPIIFLVKDTKLVKYKFNLDEIRRDHLSNVSTKWNLNDFIGFKVIQSSAFFKNTKEGIIENIISKYDNQFPEYVTVKWSDHTTTIEQTINYLDSNLLFHFSCPNCREKISNYFQNRKNNFCELCHVPLWENFKSIPLLSLSKPDSSIDFVSNVKNLSILTLENIREKKDKSEYKGKFSIDDRINRGQSPGARLSVTEQYFFVTRLYNIKHGLFATYLNLLLSNLKMKKSEFIKKFPINYQHTVGHWLRTDMGGSLPKIDDIDLLEKCLGTNIDENYKKFIQKTGLKLQSVIIDKQGKNPGDFLEIDTEELLIMFKKVVV